MCVWRLHCDEAVQMNFIRFISILTKCVGIQRSISKKAKDLISHKYPISLINPAYKHDVLLIVRISDRIYKNRQNVNILFNFKTLSGAKLAPEELKF